MPINTSFYGEETTWIKYNDFPYATYISNPSNTAYIERTRGSLSDLFRMGRLDLNEYPDLSVCYAGMSNTADVLNCRYTNYEKNEVSQKAPSSVPFFFAAGAVLNPTAAGGCIQPEADYTTWGMGTTTSTIKYEAIENGDAGIIPIVSLGGRSIVLLINVTAIQPSGDSGFDGNVVNTTLDDWYANYKDTHTRIVRIYATAYVITSNSSRSMYQAPTSWSTSVSRGTLVAVPCDPITAYGRSMMGLTKLGCDIYRSNKGFVISGSAGTVLNAAVPYANFDDSYIYPVFGKRWHIVNSSSNGRLEAWAFLDISELGGADGFMKYARKQASYFGLFFTGDSNLARRIDDAMFEDENMYLGIIDSDSITRGRYTHGTANKEQPQYNTEDLIKNSTYNPEKPTPTPLPEDTVIGPNDPKISIAGKGSKLFILRPNDIDDILDSMYGVNEDDWDALIKGLALQGSDPLGAIISYRAYMWPYTSTVSSPIYLGRTQITDEYYPVLNDNLYKQTAYFQLADDEDFITSRHLMARLFLPLYGWYQLPTDRIISQQLKVDLRYKAPDDLGCYIISFGDVVYDIVDFQPFIDIPISGRAGGYKEKVLPFQSLQKGFGAGANIGAALALKTPSALITATQSTLETITSMLTAPAVAKKQSDYSVPFRNGSSSTMLYLPMFPFIQFYKQKTIKEYNDPGYIKSTGIACDVWRTLGNMPENSLLQINNPVLNDYSNMKTEEINELNSILSSGFYR